MRKEAVYPVAAYKDRHDKRMFSVIKRSTIPQKDSVNLLGVPFDAATLGRKGSSTAPSAIREALMFNSNFNPELGLSLEKARLYDLGDVVIPDNISTSKSGNAYLVKTAHKVIRDEIRKCIRHNSLLVILGGDNSISLPGILAASSEFKNIGLIVIDSHYDMRGELAGRPTSGSSYYLAMRRLGERLKDRLVYIGPHGFLNSVFYAKRARNFGAKVFTVKDLQNENANKIAMSAYSFASEGADCVYLSIDLDCVNLGEVSGVSAPSPSGLTSSQLFAICSYIASREKTLVSDIVETSPPLDPTGRSQIVAANTICYLAAGFEIRRLIRSKINRRGPELHTL